MKKIQKIFLACGVGALLLTACEKKEEGKAQAAKPASAAQTANLPNYRYVDLDAILSKYNLAKDYNEELMRLQSNAESTMKRHESKIQSFASTVQNKMQNNGYLSEASYKQDEQTMASMQNEAQRSMNQLQNNLAQSTMQAQQTVNDSINAFIEDYNRKHGYDAIFFKAATLYINPALDFTQEVIDGLNARYNKIKK